MNTAAPRRGTLLKIKTVFSIKIAGINSLFNILVYCVSASIYLNMTGLAENLIRW